MSFERRLGVANCGVKTLELLDAHRSIAAAGFFGNMSASGYRNLFKS